VSNPRGIDNGRTGEFLAAALEYLKRGWSVIPIKHRDRSGKQPACRWKPYQETRPTEPQLRKWFARDGIDGLAVVCGQVSGGLVVRDFDDVTVYDEWRKEHPDLAASLPTVRTARGWHVYCCSKHLKSQSAVGGELHGEKTYVLLPPSRHPSGTAYQWTVSLPAGPLPEIDPCSCGLLSFVTEAISKNKKLPSNSEIASLGSVGSVGSVTLQDILLETLPQEEGQREQCLFRLARGLKFELSMAAMPPSALKPIVRQWHQAALPVIRTKAFEESWADFLRAWPRARSPLHGDPVSEAAELAKTYPPPPAADAYESNDVRRLVSFVHYLSALCWDNEDNRVFYLSFAQIERYLEIHRQRAQRFMRMFVADGLLEEVKRGVPGRAGRKGSATRWRYHGMIGIQTGHERGVNNDSYGNGS